MTNPKIPEWVQAAIAKITKKRQKPKSDPRTDAYHYDVGFAKGLKAAQDIFLRELERNKPQDEWLPIGEGYIEDRETVLLTDGKSVWCDMVIFDEEGFYFDNGSNPEAVTHWQPFPLPPKASE